jgi:hypothetical protein
MKKLILSFLVMAGFYVSPSFASLKLLDSEFQSNTVPHSGSNLSAGVRTCAPGPFHVSYINAYGLAFPAYSVQSERLCLAFSSSTRNGLTLAGPVSSSETLPTMASGLCYKFNFELSQAAPTMTFNIGGQQVCQFINYTSAAPYFTTGHGNGSILMASPNSTIADGFGYGFTPIEMTIVIRKAVGASWLSECWINAASISLYPVCIGTVLISPTDSSFSIIFDGVNVYQNTNTSWTSGHINIVSLHMADSFSLDPTSLGEGYLSYISNSENTGLIANGYAPLNNAEFALLGDEHWDPAANGRVRVCISTDTGKTWTESYFSGNDQYGVTSSSLALFDVMRNASLPNNPQPSVIPAVNVTRSPAAATANFTMGFSGSESDDTPATPNAGFIFGPFTASSPGTAHNIYVWTKASGGYINAALCAYDPTNTTHGYVGALLDQTIVSTNTGTYVSSNDTNTWTNCYIGTATIVNGQQYMLIVFTSPGSGSVTYGLPLASAVPAVVHYAGTISSTTLQTATISWDNNYKVNFFVPVTASAGFATVSVAYGSGGGILVTCADSSGINDTYQSPNYNTPTADLITHINAISGGYWHASSSANYYSSISTATDQFTLQNTSGAMNCNLSTMTIMSNQSPLNVSLGSDPNTGVMLAVTDRWVDEHTISLVGRFYDGTVPYDSTKWGPEFYITGGPMNAGTPHTGGDQLVYGDNRTTIKLKDGRWLITSEFQDWRLFPTNGGVAGKSCVVVSNFMPGTTTPMTWQQIQSSGSLQGYAYNNGSPTWSAGSAWTQTSIGGAGWNGASIGSEPSIDQLIDGRLLCIGRGSYGYWISIGSITATTGAITWADPTDPTNVVGVGSWPCMAVCNSGLNDGSYGSTNGYQRPNLWSGNSPGSVVADNINGLVYFITSARPYSAGRYWIDVWQAKQSDLNPSIVTANGGIRITKSPYGTLLTNIGVYPSFYLHNGILSGVLGNYGGAYFFRGKKTTSNGSGGSWWLQ